MFGYKRLRIAKAMIIICTPPSSMRSQQDISDALKSRFGIEASRDSVNMIMVESRKDRSVLGGYFGYGRKGYLDSLYTFVSDEAISPCPAGEVGVYGTASYQKAMTITMKMQFARLAELETSPAHKRLLDELATAESLILRLLDNLVA